jgi:hypothetical protein
MGAGEPVGLGGEMSTGLRVSPEVSRMRRLSLLGGLVLAVVAAGSALAAGPATPTISLAAAAAPTWKATFSASPVAGSATLVVPSTLASGVVHLRATGIKNGATLTALLLERTKTRTLVIGRLAFTGKLTTKGVAGKSWVLTAAERSAIKAALKAGDRLFVRLVDGRIIATGQFNAV